VRGPGDGRGRGPRPSSSPHQLRPRLHRPLGRPRRLGVSCGRAAPTRRPWHTLGCSWPRALAFASPVPPSCPSSPTGAGRRPTTTPGSISTPAGSSRRSWRPSSSPAPSPSWRTLARGTRGRHADERLLLLGFGALAARRSRPPPRLGVIDVRFVPLAQLSLALAGAAGLGLLLARIALATCGARGRASRACYADSRSQVLRHWIDWNYSGLEAKELWPAWQQLMERLRGGPATRAWRSSTARCTSGPARSACTRRCLSSRPVGDRGAYNQSSTTTHPVYYSCRSSSLPRRTRSAAGPTHGSTRRRHSPSPSPRRGPDRGRDHTARSRAGRPPRRRSRSPCPALHALPPERPGAPLRRAPRLRPRAVVAEGWADKAFHWFSRKPPNRAVLVFTGDNPLRGGGGRRVGAAARDPAAGGVEVSEAIEAESVGITTSRPGHPLLVKISYHPRWKAEGAFGPYSHRPGSCSWCPGSATSGSSTPRASGPIDSGSASPWRQSPR